MWQVEAIQVLKKYDNDLSAFVTDSVSFNTRFERIEFNAYHKQLLEMGKLSSRQLKEGLKVLTRVSSNGKFARHSSRPRLSVISAGQDLEKVAMSYIATEPNIDDEDTRPRITPSGVQFASLSAAPSQTRLPDY